MSGGGPWREWDVAWRDALYGPAGFYRRPEGPAGHFRTAAHAGPGVLAAALVRLARDAGCAGILDVGAGRGELLTALARHDDGTQHDGHPPLRLHGVDLVDRPALLPPRVDWSRADRGIPYAAFDRALVVAWELLDTVPCPVLEVDDGGRAHRVLVDARHWRPLWSVRVRSSWSSTSSVRAGRRRRRSSPRSRTASGASPRRSSPTCRPADVIRHHLPRPQVAAPADANVSEMPMAGRQLRLVDVVDVNSPDEVGPPELYAWLHYDPIPTRDDLAKALIAYFTGHLGISTTMRAHEGIGTSQAHLTVSTAPMTVSVSFHEPVRWDGWILYTP